MTGKVGVNTKVLFLSLSRSLLDKILSSMEAKLIGERGLGGGGGVTQKYS